MSHSTQHPTATVSEAIARPLRTGLQATPAWVITEAIDSFLIDLSDKQYGAAVGLLTLTFSYLQALIENYSGHGLLRMVPPKTTELTS